METLLQHFGPMLENAGVESVEVEIVWTTVASVPMGWGGGGQLFGRFFKKSDICCESR